MLLPFALYLLILAALIALTWWCHRGKRVDDHPLCRECGFDLTGKPEDSTHCPECGQDVSIPKSIRIGHRQRRGAAFAVSVFLLVVLVVLGASTAVIFARGTAYFPRLPSRVLSYLALHADVTRRPAALTELATRLTNNKLPPGSLISLIDRLLERQADLAQPWDTEAGDLIEQVHLVNALSEDRWVRYGRQALDLQIVPRKTVRAGDPIPCTLSLNIRGSKSLGGGGVGSVPFIALFSDPAVQLPSSNRSAATEKERWATVYVPAGGGMDDCLLSPWVSEALGPGKHTFTIKLTAQHAPIAGFTGSFDDPTRRWIIARTVSLEVVPSNQQTVQLLSDAETVAAARTAFEAVKLRVIPVPMSSVPFVDVSFVNSSASSLDFAIEVALLDHGHVLRKQTITCIAGNTHTMLSDDPTFTTPLPPRVTLRITPSLGAAIRSTTLITTPNLTLEIPDLPILNQQSQPATDVERGYPATTAAPTLPTTGPAKP